MIARTHTGKTKERLQASYETRLVGQHEAIQAFMEFLPAVIAALQDIRRKATLKLQRNHTCSCGVYVLLNC